MQPNGKHPHGGAVHVGAPPGPRGWARGLCQVDWTCVFFIVVLGIGTGIVTKRSPVFRPIYMGDATIAYPHIASNSVPFWVAIVVPVLLLLASAVAVEFWALRDRQGRRQAWLMLLNVLLALLAALAVTGFLTELFKRMCGRLRPDFLARCQPPQLAPGADPVPFGTTPDVTCTAPWDSVLQDGHMSFPSGHSSCSMVTGLFAALYLMWCVHWRVGRDLLSSAAAGGARGPLQRGGWSLGAYARGELVRLGVALLVLLELAWPWGVAVSRFIDNRHNASDVVGGLLLGACFAPLFAARLACHCAAWEALAQREEEEEEQQRLQYHASTSVSPNSNAVLPIVAPPAHANSSASGAGGHVAMTGMH